MNMTSGKRRLITGTLLAVSALTLLACNRGKKDEQAPDPLGYYHHSEYQAVVQHIGEYHIGPRRFGYNQLQNTSADVARSMISRKEAVPIRVLMDAHFTNLAPANGNASALWNELNAIASSVPFSSPSLCALRLKFDHSLRMRGGNYKADASASHLMSMFTLNRGNSYASAMAFDMFLRVHLGPAYPADRLMFLFTDDDMSLGEIQPDGSVMTCVSDGHHATSKVLPPGKPKRMVRSNDFLFVETFRSAIAEHRADDVVATLTGRSAARYGYGSRLEYKRQFIEHLNYSIFGWSSKSGYSGHSGPSAVIERTPMRPPPPPAMGPMRPPIGFPPPGAQPPPNFKVQVDPGAVPPPPSAGPMTAPEPHGYLPVPGVSEPTQ